MTNMINEKFNKWRSDMADMLTELEQPVTAFNKARLQTIADLKINLTAPFSFVVMGKVKAGKSSFMNALLKAQVCKVDASPCTDSIQVIEYAPEQIEERIDAHTRRIGLPIDILKSISVVDTPGTDTVVEPHQAVTKRFIPKSDLVLFVFLAKNPYSQSDWALIRELRGEWHRNIVFILQQCDTISREDLQKHLKYIENLAFKDGIEPCTIFPVSANRETEGSQDSGFQEVRAYIASSVTGGKHYAQKLLNIAQAVQTVIDETSSLLEKEMEFLQKGNSFCDTLQTRITDGRKRSIQNAKDLANRLDENYERIAAEVKRDFEQGLDVRTVLERSLTSLFNKSACLAAWQDSLRIKFQNRLNENLHRVAKEGASFLYDGMKLTLQGVKDEFQKWKAVQESVAPGDTQLHEKVADVINQADRRIDEMLREVPDAKADIRSLDAILSHIQISGVLGALGCAIMYLTNVHWIDITGGALTIAGVMLATFTLLIKRNQAIKKFNDAIDEGRAKYSPDAIDKLRFIVSGTYDHIERVIQPLYDVFAEHRKRVVPAMDCIAMLNRKNNDYCNQQGTLK